jgi:hypothetical protein
VGRRRLIPVALALALAGCGPTPPQAPGPQAHQLNSSLSSISTACGDAAAIQAFPNNGHALAKAEKQAAQQVPTLARIYKQNPNWVFQGKTVSQLVVMTKTFLDECGLHAAAGRLQRAVSG